jgi:hypothetical protein
LTKSEETNVIGELSDHSTSYSLVITATKIVVLWIDDWETITIGSADLGSSTPSVLKKVMLSEAAMTVG